MMASRQLRVAATVCLLAMPLAVGRAELLPTRTYTAADSPATTPMARAKYWRWSASGPSFDVASRLAESAPCAVPARRTAGPSDRRRTPR